MGREIYGNKELNDMLAACREGGNTKMAKDIKRILTERQEKGEKTCPNQNSVKE